MMVDKGFSALELSAKLDFLSDEIKRKTTFKFSGYGFDLSNLLIQSINLPNEDFKILNKTLEQNLKNDVKKKLQIMWSRDLN